MSFFQKLKKDIGLEEETEKKQEKKPEKVSLQETKKEAQDWMETEGQLAVDVYQTKSSFVIQAPVAGVKPEDLDIFVEDGFLIIKGERKLSLIHI